MANTDDVDGDYDYIQGTFNCGILVAEVGGISDPRRKWECERGRYHFKSVAFVCRMI